MSKKQDQNISIKDIESLLSDQTQVILSAVDERLEKREERINKKIEKLIDTLDKFLKRTTDLEDEFALMKHDLNRVKKIIQQKLQIEMF
jgi:hypothetical protein